VIADDEEEIIEAARRMSEKYDMVVTSGGIGPTYTSLFLPPPIEQGLIVEWPDTTTSPMPR
jgi:hypothetical protein